MLGPSRPFPRIGALARIRHFGGGVERGIVVAVHEEGRRVSVRAVTGGSASGKRNGEDGKIYEFVLSPATARFVSADDAHGPRLELLGGAG
jgi:hypothetical protein